MTTYVSLSRDAFRRGVKDALELRPLREAAKTLKGNVGNTKKYSSESTGSGRSVVVERSRGGSWHVRKAS